MIKDFESIIFALQSYWQAQGCSVLTAYDVEMGAGTFHPATVLKSVVEGAWNVCYLQPSWRPTDGRYAKSPNRLQHYFQFQVLMKPTPINIQALYLSSLKMIGIDNSRHDIRFVEDDWESPTLGAAGLGWEVWCDGMEISQFTYFQQMGGLACIDNPVEITYGLERIAMYVLKVDNVYDLPWNAKNKLTYKDIFLESEQEFSAYNFEYANIKNLLLQFEMLFEESTVLITKKLVYPAYHSCIKASHIFNLLDARGALSVNERAHYINQIRTLVKKCCQEYAQKHTVESSIK